MHCRNNAGYSQPPAGGWSARYQLPPNSSRIQVNLRWKPGNLAVENSKRKPRGLRGWFGPGHRSLPDCGLPIAHPLLTAFESLEIYFAALRLSPVARLLRSAEDCDLAL